MVETVRAGTVRAGTARVRTARVGMAVAVVAAMTVVLTLVTSVPPLFLLVVSCYFTAMIAAGAWILSSRHGEHAG
jgi:high-affinity Fe2+/Pb2+ permease